MAATPPRLLSADTCALLIVDIQDRFMGVVPDSDELVERALILVQACKRLNIPVVVSEQYPEGLGHTVAELTEVLPAGTAVLEKTAFGCGRDPDILVHLDSLQRRQIMVCGLETHVCVNQTVHQLLAEGYQIHLIQDALRSRHKKNAKAGLAKMTQSGAIPSCVEMALFEILGTAGHEAFKDLQALVK
jgi:nicotinamidase-related amidase